MILDPSSIFIISIIIAIALLSAVFKKLTPVGSLAGAFIALGLYLGTGVPGLILLGIFFVSGTAATSLHAGKKDQGNLAPRHAGQVLANGAMAAMLSLITLALPSASALLAAMVAGSLAAATSDTLSSEIGMVFGKRFYNILSFRREERGLNGVISLEGTLAGIVATLLIAWPYAAFTGHWEHIWVIVIAGTAGNLADSLLGATLERRRLVSNDVVNFLNTFTGAMTAGLIISRMH